MSILVVGGNGFIGSNLVPFLVACGERVRVLDVNAESLIAPCSGVEYVWGDANHEPVLARALEGIDVVYQLAGGSVPDRSNVRPIEDIENNLVGFVKFLQVCVEKGVRKVIVPSSGGTVYGVPGEVPTPEDHPTNPICSYGINKLGAEKYLHLFRHLHGLEYAVLRISNPYGQGQHPEGEVGAVSVFLGRIHRGLPVVIWGDGTVVRDYIHIDDVVRAFHLIQQYDGPDPVFNISSARGIQLNELVDHLKTMLGRDIEVQYQAARKADIPVNCLCNTKAREKLGWQPNVSLEEGLARAWDWVQTFYAR